MAALITEKGKVEPGDVYTFSFPLNDNRLGIDNRPIETRVAETAQILKISPNDPIYETVHNLSTFILAPKILRFFVRVQKVMDHQCLHIGESHIENFFWNVGELIKKGALSSRCVFFREFGDRKSSVMTTWNKVVADQQLMQSGEKEANAKQAQSVYALDDDSSVFTTPVNVFVELKKAILLNQDNKYANELGETCITRFVSDAHAGYKILSNALDRLEKSSDAQVHSLISKYRLQTRLDPSIDFVFPIEIKLETKLEIFRFLAKEMMPFVEDLDENFRAKVMAALDKEENIDSLEKLSLYLACNYRNQRWAKRTLTLMTSIPKNMPVIFMMGYSHLQGFMKELDSQSAAKQKAIIEEKTIQKIAKVKASRVKAAQRKANLLQTANSAQQPCRIHLYLLAATIAVLTVAVFIGIARRRWT